MAVYNYNLVIAEREPLRKGIIKDIRAKRFIFKVQEHKFTSISKIQLNEGIRSFERTVESAYSLWNPPVD